MMVRFKTSIAAASCSSTSRNEALASVIFVTASSTRCVLKRSTCSRASAICDAVVDCCRLPKQLSVDPQELGIVGSIDQTSFEQRLFSSKFIPNNGRLHLDRSFLVAKSLAGIIELVQSLTEDELF